MSSTLWEMECHVQLLQILLKGYQAISLLALVNISQYFACVFAYQEGFRII